VRIQ
jgi:tetratricopeptide (TPR) repeat protein